MQKIRAVFRGVVVDVRLTIGSEELNLTKKGEIWEGSGTFDLPDHASELELSFGAPPLPAGQIGHPWALEVMVGANSVFKHSGVARSDDFLLRRSIDFRAA